MKCTNCNSQNSELKKHCSRCDNILIGYVFNNVTGEYGYRVSNGLFYKKEKLQAETKTD